MDWYTLATVRHYAVRENNKSSICFRWRAPNFMCALVARGGHMKALLYNTCTSRLALGTYTYACDYMYIHTPTSAQTLYTYVR